MSPYIYAVELGKSSEHHLIYWTWDLEEQSTERSEVRVVLYSIDALGLGKIPSSPPIKTLALHITSSETWENLKLRRIPRET